MRDDYLLNILDRFIDETDLNTQEEYSIDLFSDYCISRHRYTKLADIKECNIIDEYSSFWLFSNVDKIDVNFVDSIFNGIDKFRIFVKNNFNLLINVSFDGVCDELKRIWYASREFDRFLNNPVISQSPFIIDIERYKKKKFKINSNGFISSKDKGYFMVMDVFSADTLVLRKEYTGNFIKINLDKPLISCIKPKDILFMEVRQNPFFSWEIEEVKRFYPYQSRNYIIK